MNYLKQDTLGIYRNHTGPGPRSMGANTLDSNDIYNNQDEDLGNVKEIMIDVPSGRVASAITTSHRFPTE